jgi:hypothetical protein
MSYCEFVSGRPNVGKQHAPYFGRSVEIKSEKRQSLDG